MFSFKQKIFISYVVVFFVFMALMFPFASHTVKNIVNTAMKDRAVELIDKIKTASTDEALVRRVKELKTLSFFRMSVINDKLEVLYDSHTKRVLGPRFSQEYVVDHPEVLDAIQKGIGYSDGYSELLGQNFLYIALAFDFHGKTYVLRTAFPYKYVVDLSHQFEIGFLEL